MNIDPRPPCSPDLAPCDFCLFPKHRGCRYETIEEMKVAVTMLIETRGLPWDLWEVVGTVQQVHCSWRRLFQRGLEFHVCTINKSGYTTKVWKLIECTPYVNTGYLSLNNSQGLICHKTQRDEIDYSSGLAHFPVDHLAHPVMSSLVLFLC